MPRNPPWGSTTNMLIDGVRWTGKSAGAVELCIRYDQGSWSTLILQGSSHLQMRAKCDMEREQDIYRLGERNYNTNI